MPFRGWPPTPYRTALVVFTFYQRGFSIYLRARIAISTGIGSVMDTASDSVIWPGIGNVLDTASGNVVWTGVDTVHMIK